MLGLLARPDPQEQMAYTAFDRFLAWRRFRAATPFIGFGSRVCDLGCGPGAPFLHAIEPRLLSGVGLDENPGESIRGKISSVRANITYPLPLDSGQFDHVTMLAVLEHLAAPHNVLLEAYRLLRPGGSLIMTWPSALVDPILEVLTRLRLVNAELGFHQHQPRIPDLKLKHILTGIGFTTIENGTFEFRLNNWLVAHKE
jgi:ubiquinone/menaquinone biosynthesis C-methylase UbiE